MHERIEGMRQSIAKESQRLQAPKNWLGSEEVNIFKVLCETLDLLQEMNSVIAVHTHGASPVPSNTAVFVSNTKECLVLLDLVRGITE